MSLNDITRDKDEINKSNTSEDPKGDVDPMQDPQRKEKENIENAQDLLDYVIKTLMNKSFFYDLYLKYTINNSSYTERFEALQNTVVPKNSLMRNYFNFIKILNLIIYKSRRLLLMITKLCCFVLDFGYTLIFTVIVVFIILMIVIVIARGLNIVDVEFLQCKYEFAKCSKI